MMNNQINNFITFQTKLLQDHRTFLFSSIKTTREKKEAIKERIEVLAHTLQNLEVKKVPIAEILKILRDCYTEYFIARMQPTEQRKEYNERHQKALKGVSAIENLEKPYIRVAYISGTSYLDRALEKALIDCTNPLNFKPFINQKIRVWLQSINSYKGRQILIRDFLNSFFKRTLTHLKSEIEKMESFQKLNSSHLAKSMRKKHSKKPAIHKFTELYQRQIYNLLKKFYPKKEDRSEKVANLFYGIGILSQNSAREVRRHLGKRVRILYPKKNE